MMITKRKYPWIGMQSWSNIVFLHWPVDPIVIQPFIPKPFQLDLFEGKAWVSVVFFQAHGTRGRLLPRIAPAFNQLNLRTYVKHENDGEGGVYFLNMYTDSLLANIGAGNAFNLPFRYADFSGSFHKKVQINRGKNVLLSAKFEPKVKLIHNKLSTFLTERYCIWNKKKRKIIKIPILHKKWRLQSLRVEIDTQNLFPFTNKIDMKEIVTHYSPCEKTVIFPYETIKK